MSGIFMCSPSLQTSNSTRELLTIEETFDRCRTFTWLEQNWQLSYYFIAAYVAAIFAGKEYMKTRPPYKLQTCMFFWNGFLALFSIFLTWRGIPALLLDVQEHGFYGSICIISSDRHKKATALWTWLFILSKVVEFGDTAFIILRKTPLIFLHWYHHLSVTFFAWCCAGAYMSSMNPYFGTFNGLVHSIMYSYYAMAAVKIRVSKPIRMAITSLQLVQMVYGMFITGYIYVQKIAGRICMVPDQAIIMASGIYFSYFLLFLNFFFRTYLWKKPKNNGAVANGKKRN